MVRLWSIFDMVPKYSDEFVEDVLNNEIKNYNREDRYKR